jgi:hypothetical protein
MNDDYRQKFSFDLEQSKPREFSSHDLDGYTRNVYSKDRPLSPNDSSRALAGAMKALQEKIKALESELQMSREQAASLENKNAIDREKWQTRLLEEIQMTKEKENYLQIKVYEMEEDLKKTHAKLVHTDEQLKIKEIQCRFAENEAKRTADQFSVEIENMALQLDHLQKALNAKTSSEKKALKSLEQAVREKELSEEELKQQKRINSSLQAEVNYLRENSDYKRTSIQKNHESVENELTQQNLEFMQKIKELQIKNKSLRELSNNQSQQILHLKKEISDFNRSCDLNTTSKLDVIKSKSFTKKPPVKVKPSRQSISPNRKAADSRVLKSGNDSEDVFKKHILACEKEIDKLSGSYRDLISLSSHGSGDLSTFRKEMAKIATDIERKNEELYEYKKKQQEFLREKLIN